MSTEEDVVNQATNQRQVLVTIKLHTMKVKLHSKTELHLGTELQTEEIAHLDSKVSIHERDAEIPDRNTHSDTEAERQNEETRVEPTLSKYVKRHHLVAQIIGDKYARPMTRDRLRSESCLVSMKEPKIVNDALEDVEWFKATEEEIEPIQKNKTWSLVPRLEDKM